MYNDEFEPLYSCQYCRFNPGGRPPFQPPFIGPGQPQGPGRPPGGGFQVRPPLGPPPSYTPSKHQALFQGGGIQPKFVDPGAIRHCLFRFVYIWLRNGRSFWAYLTFVGRRSVAGWRWNGFNWVYFGIDLRRIESFTCI